ncbi:hypothetical protein HBI38_072560 [Parastagonospora nodorum]|nr:hypothetical protein HBI73_040660 [Parastagonospora nodorum]KAH5656445.1 hypothetical protein HBI23_146600 [Parastagonospora nodorum]KAH5731712.1 hypothetical protein HBI18_092080 [Parastagonospora nodorum]KAH6273763.1 hypothetical protein HBI41_073790 [Parastagonospora nodorum]KAH6294141.1 hypothetical protein HBI40_065710 [Parastagonospora nodorum]
MLRRNFTRVSPWSREPICIFCNARAQSRTSAILSFSATGFLSKRERATSDSEEKPRKSEKSNKPNSPRSPAKGKAKREGKLKSVVRFHSSGSPEDAEPRARAKVAEPKHVKENPRSKNDKEDPGGKRSPRPKRELGSDGYVPMSLAEAMAGEEGLETASKKGSRNRDKQLEIQVLEPQDLTFEPVDVEIPPVPMLSYGLDRVLFNPGVYRLQDPRSRIYNFDPYLEKIMPVNEFDFDALSEYKTSSKDETLLELTKRLGTKYTGSTSSMSGVLQHFHFLLSKFRELNHKMLSRGFPDPSKRFSKITFGPDAIFLRYKDGIYAIDADKTYDTPNIMSWLGHSLEKLLTSDRKEFESFRRSSPEPAPAEDNSSRCYHYSKQGNLLMRSQLDAHDPRLPGTGVFDLKTRAVVSIRMNHKEYESGTGYQLRYAQGEWESFEREFYDMTRATMLKYSLQVRMGRMDGIFLAYHNIERIFGFQYLPLGDMDRVLHGQEDTRLGDQEFKLSVALVDELLGKATAAFPETTIRLHFETRDAKVPFMYVFAEPVTEEQADELQSKGEAAQKHFARTVVGLGKNQEEWQNIQDEVDEQVDEDEGGELVEESAEKSTQEEDATETAEEPSSDDNEGQVAEGVDEIEVDESVEESEVDEDVDESEVADGENPPTDAAEEATPSGPLMGWTLTTRSKVNGCYVDRPVGFTAEDEWQLEYHIQEIPEASRWRLYEAVKERRRGLIGQEEQEVDKSLQNYRALIQRFSNRGRAWREEQDKMNEEMGIQIYKPMGPGSENAVPTTVEMKATPEKTG